MKVGRYEVSVHNHGFFRLDGGAMFGVVPKPLWSRESPADEQNRILLATRSLVVSDGERKLIVDLGCGDKWTEKTRSIFCIPEGPYIPVPGITDVLLTHLHFDHAGGVSSFNGNGDADAGVLRSAQDDTSGVEANYPTARHYVSRTNYENAKRPSLREKASYFSENVDALEKVDLTLTEDGQEIWPGITVHRADGHTVGLQWIKLVDGGETVAFPADLCPTSKHLPIPFVMGYDVCAETSMREKEGFMRRAIEESWMVVFEHDPEVAAARLSYDSKGRPAIREVIEL